MSIDFSDRNEIQCLCNNLRKYTCVLILACFILSAVYFLYWILLECNDYLYKFTGHFFDPIAKLLNPNTNDFEVFKQTGLEFFIFCFPLSFFHYFIDKLESVLLKRLVIEEEIDKKENLNAQYKNYLSQFDKIKKFSINLSLNYKGNNDISENRIEKFNLALFSKLYSELFKKHPDLKSKTLYDNSIFIVLCDDFSMYDMIYEDIIANLAVLKKNLEDAITISIIPNITTDAYETDVSISKIKKRHFEILNFIEENKSVSTEMFQQKYIHLQQEGKYVGSPIGEFVSSSEEDCYFELNEVCKNLNAALA